MSVKSTQTLIINQARNIINRHWLKFLVLGLWILIIGTYWRIASDAAPTLEGKIHLVVDWFLVAGWGPVLFLLFFSLQPLVFFPSFIMSILAGLLYGPLWGMLFSVIGLNSAASVTYFMARFLGEDTIRAIQSNRWAQRYVDQLHSRTFETLLTLHLLYAPFDLINYLAGFMRLNWRTFSTATALGTIPSSLAYVLFGNSLGSLDQIASGHPEINVPLLVFSIALAVGAYLGTRYMRRNNVLAQAETTSEHQPIQSS